MPTTPHHSRKKVLQFIQAYRDLHGISPSLREICSGCGISSTNTVTYILDKLERDGLIRRTHYISRSIVLCDAAIVLCTSTTAHD